MAGSVSQSESHRDEGYREASYSVYVTVYVSAKRKPACLDCAGSLGQIQERVPLWHG